MSSGGLDLGTKEGEVPQQGCVEYNGAIGGRHVGSFVRGYVEGSSRGTRGSNQSVIY
jgi:hypothetical protein